MTTQFFIDLFKTLSTEVPRESNIQLESYYQELQEKYDALYVEICGEDCAYDFPTLAELPDNLSFLSGSTLSDEQNTIIADKASRAFARKIKKKAEFQLAVNSNPPKSNSDDVTLDTSDRGDNFSKSTDEELNNLCHVIDAFVYNTLSKKGSHQSKETDDLQIGIITCKRKLFEMCNKLLDCVEEERGCQGAIGDYSKTEKELHFSPRYTKEKLSNLYDYLVNKGYINRSTEFDQFYYYFSGHGEEPHRQIEWLGSNAVLAVMIQSLYGDSLSKEGKIWKKGEHIFGIKNLAQSRYNTYISDGKTFLSIVQ